MYLDDDVCVACGERIGKRDRVKWTADHHCDPAKINKRDAIMSRGYDQLNRQPTFWRRLRDGFEMLGWN